MRRPAPPFKGLRGLTEAAAFLGVLFTLAGLAGNQVWFFEIFTHAKVQLALCFFVYAVIELTARRHRLALAGFAFCAANAFPSLLLFVPAEAGAHAAPPAHRLRILQANVLTCNTNAPALLTLVARENPDVVVLQEPDDWWLRKLAPLTNDYPVCATLARDDNFGAAIYAKTNALSADIFTLGDPDAAPSTCARIAVGGAVITVVGTHTLAPYTRGMWDGRNRFTHRLAEKLRTVKDPLVVTGDFNNTPWSAHYRDFVETSGLLDSSRGRGPLPSWPASAPAFLRIPLDHCFHSPDVRILAKRLCPDIGSDHLPLLIDVAF